MRGKVIWRPQRLRRQLKEVPTIVTSLVVILFCMFGGDVVPWIRVPVVASVIFVSARVLFEVLTLRVYEGDAAPAVAEAVAAVPKVESVETLEVLEKGIGEEDIIQRADELHKQHDFEGEYRFMEEHHFPVVGRAVDHCHDVRKLWRAALNAVSLAELAKVAPNDSEWNETEHLEHAEALIVRANELAQNEEPAEQYGRLRAASIVCGAVASVASNKQKAATLAAQVAQYAQQCLNLELPASPQDGMVHYVLGRWHLRLSQMSWIERKVFATLARSVPNLPEPTLQEALRHMQNSVRHDASSPSYHLVLGQVYNKMGRKREAQESWQTAAGLPLRCALDERSRQRAQRSLDALQN
ncbi:MAG: hypothetical protein MHM6MM_005484 [Cercozoa sp. M6MM]